jgi:uncharacterized protein (DUF302 family)
MRDNVFTECIMLLEVQSNKSMDEIERGLQESAARHKFGIIATHDLKQTLLNKGVELDQDCRVYEVCNPQQAKKVLDANGAISTALPCRISVYGKPGQYRISTMRPTELMKGFDAPSIGTVAQEVEQVLQAMMTEAAG